MAERIYTEYPKPGADTITLPRSVVEQVVEVLDEEGSVRDDGLWHFSDCTTEASRCACPPARAALAALKGAVEEK